MSNKQLEKSYDNISDWFNFVFGQKLKNLNTALPGIVSSYNSDTRRAVVKVGLTLQKTDGTTLEYPAIADVPVLFPASSQYLIQFPLVSGDAVMLLFSQRGIASFKQNYTNSTAAPTSFFSLQDAVASVGFGTKSAVPATENALTVQTTDGNTFFSLQDGIINIQAQTINLIGDVNAQTLSIDGNALPSNHRHDGVTSGGDISGTPVP